jgi:hypothetical protein
MEVIGSGNFDSDNINLVIRLFFGDVRHGFVDFLEDEVYLFHYPVVKGLHKLVDWFIAGVIHFDFL